MGSNLTDESKLRVLHVILHVNETNGQYNEHCLPLLDVREISICTYFEPNLKPPAAIHLFPGDGSLSTFFQVLDRAVNSRPHDVIHVHAPQSGALVVLALLMRFQLRRFRSSMVYTVQDSFYDYSLRNQALMVIALAGFREIIFCSRAAYESLPRPWKWLVRGKWHVVQNAADIERVDRALTGRDVRAERDRFTVLSVGRLEPVKDPGTLLDAFASLDTTEAELVVVGTGSMEPSVKDLIGDYGLEEDVTLTGLIPRDDVFRWCASADVLVSTSHGEGLPVAVIEAMAARCPVVLSDIPPHRELADDADFIPLVPLGDREAFAREIRRFKAMSEEERRNIGRLCREHVLARFTLPIMHQGTEEVYRKLPSLSAASSGTTPT